MTSVPSPKTFAMNGNGSGLKLYILTSKVTEHHPECFFQFAEHNVFIPAVMLEEMGDSQKGASEAASCLRRACEILEGIISSNPDTRLEDGYSLEHPSGGIATGRLFIQPRKMIDPRKRKRIGDRADDEILDLAENLPEFLRKLNPSAVIVVARHSPTRIKAKLRNVRAEDYRFDHAIEDADLLYRGYRTLPENFWSENGDDLQSKVSGDHTEYVLKSPFCGELTPNEILYVPDPGSSGGQLQLVAHERDAGSAVLRTITNYRSNKHRICGITARNDEQVPALHLLMDPDVLLASIVGMVGSGKTILALAAGLQQVMDGRYSRITYIKATMPIGREEGFVPGDEAEKTWVWSGALADNLEVLRASSPTLDNWLKTKSKQIPGRITPPWKAIEDVIELKSLNYIRGRSFFQRYIISDETQLLSRLQALTLVTRVGAQSKIVCLGNLAQIDSPDITPVTSGLTHIVQRFKGWKHNGHIMLQTCERSLVAGYGGNVLKIS